MTSPVTPTGAWMQTVEGRAVQLDRPPAPGSVTAAATQSGTLNMVRFAGQCPVRQIPIMQHELWGCDAILYESGDVVSAVYFLLHDEHEGVLGDWTTPVVDGLVSRAGAIHPLAGPAVRAAVKGMKHDIDVAVHALHGLPFPIPQPYAARVKEMDLRMLEVERRWRLEEGLDRASLPPWSSDSAPPRDVRVKLVQLPSPEALLSAYRTRLADLVPKARAVLAQLDRPPPGDDAERLLRLARSH